MRIIGCKSYNCPLWHFILTLDTKFSLHSTKNEKQPWQMMVFTYIHVIWKIKWKLNFKFGFSFYPTLVPLIRGPGTKPHCSNRAGYQLMPFITARDHWMVNIQDLFGLSTRFVGREIIENTRLLFWMEYIKSRVPFIM